MVTVLWTRFRIILSVLVLVFVITPSTFSQDKKTNDPAIDNDRTISADSSPDQSSSNIVARGVVATPYDMRSDGRSFLKDILKDQQAIFTSPAHIRKKDIRYLAPVGIALAALLATDHQNTVEVNEHPSGVGTRFSYRVGQASDFPTAIGIVAGLYGFGRLTHRDHMKETGKLTAEALINSTIVVEVLKIVARRERPSSGGINPSELDQSRGRFEVGGASFPSGHSIEAWTIAGVLSEQYKDHPWVVYSSYGLAALVSVSRVTSRQHFSSDVLAGSAIGYLIGRYVARSHSAGPHPIPTIAPIVNRTVKSYGLQVGINF